MKKAFALFLALCMAAAMLGGCAEKKEEVPQTISEETETSADEIPYETPIYNPLPEDLKTIGDVVSQEGIYICQTAAFGNYYIVAYLLTDNILYRAIAYLPDETAEALFAMDIFAEDYEEQEKALTDPLEVTKVENLSALIPSQEELDKWVGKTGQEMLDAGWTSSGYNLYEKQFYMDFEMFDYLVTMEGEMTADENDQIDGEEAFKSLVIQSVVFDHLANACYDLEQQAAGQDQ